MTYNIDELNQLKELWQAAEAETGELQFPILNGPQLPLGAVPIPIPSTARQKARRMAALCRNAERRETMQRNLLATIVVHDYLNLQGYLPDLGASDSWNPIIGRTGEVADLVVSQVGRFECCAIEPGQLSCSVPAEGQFGRSGYVAVEMDAEERWGWLLGFLPGGDEIDAIETLNRKELQSMDEFGHYLQQFFEDVLVPELSASKLRSLKEPKQPTKTLVNLGKWLDNRIEEGWQQLEALLNPEQLIPALHMRSTLITRGKLIYLETELMRQTIALVIRLNSQSEKGTNIIVEVRPNKNQLYLPGMLQVKVLDDQKKAVMEAIASDTNQNIQFDFNVVSGERFGVKMTLGGASVTEDFVV
ncbi:DUF1822 family protein [Altericista sp. CCNU0014]|uniref:DUF1822 family protein n=1 Tax=Altericista sp. CCNU0014 TaxID=3082949 RepID=UPI00384F0AB7